ncbi:MAG: bifunctional hydroxymethylpyrimidine kinase/phosphomethylpyrimidine kinase [Spirochaetota bacterium]|nr:bifunctional hydroxymethylpyrimidine kinase/phosphomethylpyrimidine kinase [Spirochaetota bacterium]
MKPICVMTIAGSDSSCGAGIQADLKTFSALGVYGVSVITAITSQNSLSIRSIHGIEPEIVKDQIEAIFDDFNVCAVKVGMLYSKQIIQIVVSQLKKHFLIPIIVDPIIISTTGKVLLEYKAIDIMKYELFPLANIITPNITELEFLTGIDLLSDNDVKNGCSKLYNQVKTNILVKGGHRKDMACDILYDGSDFHYFSEEKIGTSEYHGTGCTLSSAIASYLGIGFDMISSIDKAKKYVTQSIRSSYKLGKGMNMLNHFWNSDLIIKY